MTTMTLADALSHVFLAFNAPVRPPFVEVEVELTDESGALVTSAAFLAALRARAAAAGSSLDVSEARVELKAVTCHYTRFVVSRIARRRVVAQAGCGR
jgi:hypothetical protein